MATCASRAGSASSSSSAARARHSPGGHANNPSHGGGRPIEESIAPSVNEAILSKHALWPERGVAVLPDGTSATVFLLHDRSLHAVGNLDPFYGVPVMCHGIVGDRAGAPTIASPLGKQVFCLRTGRCLDDSSVSLPVFHVSAGND